jgi:hypothetical protein
MSGTQPVVKISLEDSQSFYENVYKAVANDKNTLKRQSENYVDELSKNGLAQKQYEYKKLSEDFLAVVKERKVSIGDTLKYLGVSDETWSIWRQSVNANSKITPVTFNNAIVFKMSAMVLKDIVVKHLEEKNLTEYSQDILKEVIKTSKARLEVNESVLNKMFDSFDNTPVNSTPSSKPKIKP